MSAAVAEDSSYMTPSSSASWTRFSPPSNFVNGHVSTMWFMICHWPQSLEGDWARPNLCKTCPETVHQRSCMTTEIETWLSDSRVCNNSVVDHRSRWPVHCITVSTDVMSDHTGCQDASRGGGYWKTSAYTGQFGWASKIWSILSVATLWRNCLY